jgi:hypothetical protein
MAIRYASAVLTLSGVLALILGLLFWFGAALDLVSLHMLLGLLAVGALWLIGISQFYFPSGSRLIGLAALVVGALTAALGLYQSALMLGPSHWIVRVIHLLLGVLTIGLGHMGAARYRKSTGE